MKLLLENTVIKGVIYVGGVVPEAGQELVWVDEIPAEVTAGDPSRYCYTQSDGYYLNPSYVPPEAPYDEDLETQEMLIDHEFRISLLELGA